MSTFLGEDQSSDELASLYHQLFRLHLVQPMGALKAQRKQLEDSGARLVKRRTEDGTKWRVLEKWDKKVGGKKGKDDEKTAKPCELEDFVIARLVPAPYFNQVSEPAAMVLNPNGTRLHSILSIRRIVDAATPAYRVAMEQLENAPRGVSPNAP